MRDTRVAFLHHSRRRTQARPPPFAIGWRHPRGGRPGTGRGHPPWMRPSALDGRTP